MRGSKLVVPTEVSMRKQGKIVRYSLGLAMAAIVILTILGLGSVAPTRAQVTAPSWSYTGSLNTARAFHTTTVLSDGNVLVVGGSNRSKDCVTHFLDSAELYDPVNGKWSVTGSLNVPRDFHTATLLRNGKVLVVGGVNGRSFPSSLNSVELYDP